MFYSMAQMYLLMVLLIGAFLAGMMTITRGFIYAAMILVAFSVIAGCSAPAIFR